MKKLLLKILVLSSCLILSLSFLNINAENLNEGELSFAILSDVHINEKDKSKSEKMKRAISIINNKNFEIEKYIFTGDYTNSGSIEEYKLFNDICSNNKIPKNKRAVLMGNHDYWNGLDIKSSKNRFKTELGEKIYKSEKINGYTLIFLSTENDEVNGYYSKESLNFATEKIKESIKDDENKPIFIFTHHPPKNTTYGSEYWGNNELKEVFSEYSQVLLFAGHSHFPLNDERGIYQNKYTVVNCGGIGGLGLEEGTVDGKFPSDIKNESQGIIVTVDKSNRVTINRIDFSNNKEIKEPWVIKYADNGKANYQNSNIIGEEPYFEVNSTVKKESRHGENVKITFNQAKDNDMVHSYKIEVYEKKVTSSKRNIEELKVQENYMFSKFYLGDRMPEKLIINLSNIKKDKDYIVKIYAIDSFGNISSKYLSCEITK